MNCSHFSVKDWTSWLGVVGVIRTAMSRSLPATARPRAHELTTRIMSTYACDAKKSPTRPATSRWSAVGNLSAGIIDCSVRRKSAFARPNHIPQRKLHNPESGQLTIEPQVSDPSGGHLEARDFPA